VLNQAKCEQSSKCWGEREINVGEKVTGCSLEKTRATYLHKGEWQRLMTVEAGSFDVVTNGEKTFLKVLRL
jgi:hypothetical protein